MRPSVLTCIHKVINRAQAREGLEKLGFVGWSEPRVLPSVDTLFTIPVHPGEIIHGTFRK